uniref:Putative neck protein n=1 Tax=viral metagenome TaxID=1070528 RepID=A0A6M3J8Z6_9ZZZZ
MGMYSNTQQVIRHYVSSAVGDLLYGQCGTTGATTQLIYAPFLWKPDSYYSDYFYEVYVYAGVNIGVTKRATAWTLSSFLLQVHSVYTAACNATSYIELHRIFTVDELNKAINLAIEHLAGKYLIDLKDESTIRLTSTTDNLDNTVYTYEYALPLSFLYLHNVITEDKTAGVKLTGTVSGTFTKGETITGGTSLATGELSYGVSGGTYIRVRKVDGTFVTGETATGGTSLKTCSAITAVAYEPAGMGRFLNEDRIDSRNWSVIKSYPPKLKLDKRYYSVEEDLYLRLEGQGTQPIVDDDADIIYLPPAWIVQKAITFLPQNKLESNKLQETYRAALAISAVEPKASPHSFNRAIVE